MKPVQFEERMDNGEALKIIVQRRENTYCNFSSELKIILSDFLDADYGLLEKLRCVLTDRQYQSLRNYRGYDRNDKLMEIVNLLPRDHFLNALSETGQQHIVNFITHVESSQVHLTKRLLSQAVDVNEACWPLNEKQRNILTSNLYDLAVMIDVKELLPILCSSSCISPVHYDCLMNEKETYDCSLCLLTILLKRSQADYQSFISALTKIGQSHLVSILSEGGGVVAVHAVHAEPDLDDEVVTKFRQWLRSASQEERQQKLKDLFGPDMALIGLQKCCSVAVFIHCKTLSAIQDINEMLENGTLKSAVEKFFSTLLDGRHVEIKELDFYESSYNACLHFFYKSLGCYDKLIVCDLHDRIVTMEQRKCVPITKDLPIEVLETVLVKSVVLIFELLMKCVSINADNLAVTTLLMVCRHWRLVLEKRPFIKVQIKGTFDHGSESKVQGVAILDNTLFVLCDFSSTVRVFDLTAFTQLPSIELKDQLKNPCDIVTCEVTRRIYIADSTNDCVWRIDWSPPTPPYSTAAVLDDSSPAVKFVNCEGHVPWKLSTNGQSQQLLVTDGDGYSLFVYDVNGKLLRRVELSREVDDDGVQWDETRHVVRATTGESYLVCRWGSYQQQQRWGTHAEVAEYNPTGQRLRSYYSGPRGDGPQQVNWPAYMSLIDDGHFVVVDELACRVLLLNTELKLERVLLTRQQLSIDDDENNSKPQSLCYDSQTGLLCVTMVNGRVNVYKIS